jgi:hypothetical protein
LQNLEPEEEINISDSPAEEASVHRASADLTQQSASAEGSNKSRKKKKKVHFLNYFYSITQKISFVCSSL